MKRIALLLVSIFLSSCVTTDYVKQVKVSIDFDYDVLIQFVDADSNGVLDYMHNKLIRKDETPIYEWNTKQVKFKINKDSTELTEKDITKYLCEKVYGTKFFGDVADTLPPNLSGILTIDNIENPKNYYCEITFKNDTNVTIEVPATTFYPFAHYFNIDTENDPFDEIEKELGKNIWQITDEDRAINISMASDNNSINVHFGDLMVLLLEWVEMFDLKGDKVYSKQLNKQKYLNVPIVGFKNGSYVMRFTPREPWSKDVTDRVVIISR